MERWKECDYYEILLYYARHESFMEKEKKNLKSHLKMKTHAGKKNHTDFKKKKVNSKNA